MTQTHSEQDTQTSTQGTTDEQSLYDGAFQAISQGVPTGSNVDWAREYFDSMERRLVDFAEQLRSARRVAEVAALGQHKQQIAVQAAYIAQQQLLTRIQRDPSLRQQLMGSGDSGNSSKRS